MTASKAKHKSAFISITNAPPAILGGTPVSASPMPFVRPVMPRLGEMRDSLEDILQSGQVTSGKYVEEFEAAIARHLGVNHAVAVSSCTSGLMLAFRALDLPPGSEVVLPSFTFMATGLGPVWNGLKLRFADVNPATGNLDPRSAGDAVTQNTSAIAAVHLYGNPAPCAELQVLADRRGLALVYDAAHGFGSLREGAPPGRHGHAEAFSLSPTKLLIAGEGGVVATNNGGLAERVKLGRNYANPGNYDALFPGLNARMSEFHAICALNSLRGLEAAAETRNRAAETCRECLASLPGVRFPAIPPENRCSYKDLTIFVDEREFGLSRALLKRSLEAEGIQTRVYYSPALHRMTAFREFAGPDADERLPNTLRLEASALSLPMYSDMTADEAETVCEAVWRIHRHAEQIRGHAREVWF